MANRCLRVRSTIFQRVGGLGSDQLLQQRARTAPRPWAGKKCDISVPSICFLSAAAPLTSEEARQQAQGGEADATRGRQQDALPGQDGLPRREARPARQDRTHWQREAGTHSLAEVQRIQNESDPLDSLCSWAFQLCTRG